MMAGTITLLKSAQAPCGRMVDGEQYQEQDDQGLITDHLYFACGCRRIRHEYHDGSAHRMVVRHDGKILMDELVAEH
jgi:hypothetical protein